MGEYVGSDVSEEETAFSVTDGDGKVSAPGGSYNGRSAISKCSSSPW